ncbi:cytochrome b562 [Verrucomicrobiota bacterium sgz303538]
MKTLLTFVAAIAMGFTAFAADDDTPLAKQMSSINKSLRTVKRNLADPSKKQDNLDLLKKIHGNIEEALKLEPKKTSEQANKQAYVAKYKEEVQALGKTFQELEEAIKADKTDEAKKLVEKLSEQKEKGHKDFDVD